MPEDIAETPGQQATTPVQQANAPAGQAAPQENWKARYDGLVLKVQELTLANQSLTTQLSQKSSELEQLNAQLGIKDVEKQTAVSERDQRLQQALQDNQAKDTELAELRGLKLKVEVAKELGRPELLKIADKIPALTDKEALKTVMQDIAGFADEAVKAREQQLMAGVVPSTNAVNLQQATPTTDKGWDEYIDKFPLGSPERAKALDDYGDFLERKYAPQR